jgi:hypothetical protein
MNIEKHTQTVAPSVGFSGDVLGRMLPALLTKGEFGLSSLPKATLEQNLEAIVHSLERLDAELLLDLHRSKHGPRVAEGYVDRIFERDFCAGKFQAIHACLSHYSRLLIFHSSIFTDNT